MADLLQIFQVEVTSRCNLRCNFCPHASMTRPKRDMRVVDFEHIARNFTPGQTVGLYMMGEPLLHPDFFDLVKITMRREAIPEIASNALLLQTDDFRERVLLCGIDLLLLDISIHKEDVEIMERCVLYAEATAALACDLAKKGEVPPLIMVQIVDSKGSTQKFSSRMVNLAFNNPEVVQLSRKFLDTWAGQEKELYDRTSVKTPEVRRPCREPWNRCSVLQNGDVVPCCRDAHGQYVYGNLLTQTMEEIEASPALKHMRQRHITCQWDKLPEPCRSCREWHIPMDRHRGEV